jgi:hypothetical protein
VQQAARKVFALLILNPEDKGDTSLRNVISHTDYTALYPRRWQPSYLIVSIFRDRFACRLPVVSFHLAYYSTLKMETNY